MTGGLARPFRVVAANPRDGTLALGLLAAVSASAVAAAARPAEALVAAAAVLVVATALLYVELGILLVVATAPLEGAFASGPAGISVTKLAGVLCFAGFAVAVLRSRRPLRVDGSHGIVLALLALAALSSTQALDAGSALSTTVRYASFVGVYLVLGQFGDDPRLRRRLAWVLAGASGVAAGLGIANYLDGATEFAQLRHANQNDFAFILATSLPLMFWLFGTTTRRLRPVVLLLIGVVLGGTVLSFSRGALVGLVAGLVFLAFTDRRHLRLALGIAALAVAAGALAVGSDAGRFHDALFAKEQVAQENVSNRFEAWGAAARLAVDHPFLGVGPGNFRFYYGPLTDRPAGTSLLSVAHDAYLDVGAELGIGAAVLFVLYLGLAFRGLSAAGRGPAGGYAQAVRVSLVVASISALFLSEQYFLPFWLIGGLAAAMRPRE